MLLIVMRDTANSYCIVTSLAGCLKGVSLAAVSCRIFNNHSVALLRNATIATAKLKWCVFGYIFLEAFPKKTRKIVYNRYKCTKKRFSIMFAMNYKRRFI